MNNQLYCFYLLSDDEEEVPSANYNKVHFLKPHLLTRFFRTLVGSERVSPQKMVEQMFEGNFPYHCSSFSLEPLLKDYYFSNEKPERECLCHSLLLTLTFMEVILKGKSLHLSKDKILE